jgi:hypothetical protein
MDLIYGEALVRARLAERLAEIDLGIAPVGLRPGDRPRCLGQRRRRGGSASN